MHLNKSKTVHIRLAHSDLILFLWQEHEFKGTKPILVVEQWWFFIILVYFNETKILFYNKSRVIFSLDISNYRSTAWISSLSFWFLRVFLCDQKIPRFRSISVSDAVLFAFRLVSCGFARIIIQAWLASTTFSSSRTIRWYSAFSFHWRIAGFSMHLACASLSFFYKVIIFNLAFKSLVL